MGGLFHSYCTWGCDFFGLFLYHLIDNIDLGNRNSIFKTHFVDDELVNQRKSTFL